MASDKKDKVQGYADVLMVDDPPQILHYDSPGGNAFLQITWEDGTRVRISTNIGEMIGGAALGLRRRQEDLGRRVPGMNDGRAMVVLNAVIAAWMQLEEGPRSIRDVQRWLTERMKPAIDDARVLLGLPTEKPRD
jgi:hypothetical protein